MFSNSDNWLAIKPTQLAEPAMTYQMKSTTQRAKVYFSQHTNIYGTVVLLSGGRTSALCLDTNDYGVVTVNIPREVLLNIDRNLLYQIVGLVVKARKSRLDGSIEGNEVDFIEFLDYGNKEYSLEKLDAFIEHASKEAKENNVPDNWLEELRGSFEE